MRAEIAPWEAKIADAQSRHNLAASGRDLLMTKQTDARQRVEVGLASSASVIAACVGC